MANCIVVAVQHRLRFFREGLRLVLDDVGDIRVAGTAVSGPDLVELCLHAPPDVAVVDVDGDPSGTLRSCAALSGYLPRLGFVGVHGDEAELDPIRAAGLRLLVPRAAGVDGLLAAVRAAHGETAGPIGVVDAPRPRKDLTSREVDVLSLVGAGHTNEEISERLAISRKTVASHKQRIFSKLDVQNQAHAVVEAVNHGLITPDSIIELDADRPR